MSRSFDPMQLGSIELFCKAAELSSFTAAAQALGITPAAVSRSVGRLEARLGARLFVRSTRQIRLTDDGRSYFEQCEQALAQIEQAGRVVSGRQSEPSGTLRISVPTTYAHHRLFPLLPAFNAAFPKLKLEISVSNRNIDFVEEGFDLAIRLGAPADSRLVARPLEEATLGVFASPAYLKQRGTPATLADLRQHDCIPFVLPRTGRAVAWLFREDGVDIERAVDGPVRVLDDVLGCVSHARAGGGLCQIYHFIAEGAVRSGELKEVLKPFGGRSRPFTILYPHNRHVAPRVRAFVDFVVARVSAKAQR
ncbi:LysR family transcriptional regulator [Ideonella sp.]|uniref:LysR family transcriptional regulator n=1 Tax=Ideonella sp. TaxID=1929293 RepID=UPI0035AF2CA3